MSVILYNSDLIDCWLTATFEDKETVIYKYIQRKIGSLYFDKNALLQSIHFFNVKMTKFWRECKSNKRYFEQMYSSWLSTKFFDSDNQPSTSKMSREHLTISTSESKLTEVVNIAETSGTDVELIDVDSFPKAMPRKRGRPMKAFNSSAKKTKHRRVADLISKYSLEELEFAVKKLKQKYHSSSETCVSNADCLSTTEALALYVDLDLSERKYIVLRKTINELHPDCLPSLYTLQNEKKKMVPPVTVTEYSAEVDLRTLMRRTAEGVLQQCNANDKINKVSLICKWGMDGSSGHSRYKQKFETESYTDEFMVFVAFVPLRLVDLTSKKDLWFNRVPSSTLYCRPIKFIFEKENPNLIKEVFGQIDTCIKSLEADIIEMNDVLFEVSYEMHCTMLDGAVANILSNTNCTSRCFICKASPTEMNNVNISKVPCPDNYKYGLSPLHCWIKCFECLLHIAYRIPFKTWRVCAENKQAFTENKKRIQKEFKIKTGLIVDEVKTGFGTTNDGNTARRFFKNSSVSAEITGVKKELIDHFEIILRVLSCSFPINTETFNELLLATRDIYLNNYGWYYMPSTVHKILIHGSDIAQFFDLPIGCLSEEALEANHKNVRKARLCHTRKTSRKNTNKDLMAHLLLISDPLLSSKRNIKTKENLFLAGIEKYIITKNLSTLDVVKDHEKK